MRKLILIPFILLQFFLAEQSIHAQSDLLKPGSTVRVHTLINDEGPIIGTVRELTEFDMAVDYRNRIIYIPYRTIDRLAVRSGVKRKTGRGALVGLGSGAAIGGLIGAITYKECVSQGWLDCMFAPESRASATGTGALLGGLVGVLTGAVIGATKRTYQWVYISNPRYLSPGRYDFAKVTGQFYTYPFITVKLKF
jgi:hypothetical protein